MAALCDLDANGTARVAAQWSFEPYGDVIAAEHIHDFPVQTLGHKGLFLDRLDNPTNGPVSLGGNEAHRLVPFAHSLYHNRNRAYSPSVGRFLQQDPNQTAMSLLEGSYHGSAMGAAALSYSLEGLYTDGFSLYQYLGSSPVSRFDPTGLSSDPFDMVDDYLATDAGAKRALMERITGSANTTAFALSYIASALPFLATAILGELGISAMDSPEMLSNSEAWSWIEAGLDLATGELLNTGVTLVIQVLRSRFGSKVLQRTWREYGRQFR